MIWESPFESTSLHPALAVQQLHRLFMHARIAGGDDAAAALGGPAFPGGDDAAGPGAATGCAASSAFRSASTALI